MSKLDGKVIRAVRDRDTGLGRLVGRSLRQLRQLAGLTQADLAERLEVGQSTVSKIEQRADVQISFLQKYVEALGATLRIEAAFSPSSAKSLRLAGIFDPEIQDEDQLVFPLFGEDLFRPTKDVVLSVRPHYSVKILKGIKTVELRRRFPVSAPRGVTAYIYSTSPVRAMVGSAEIKNVTRLPVAEIWRKYAKMAQVDRSEFNEYFSGLKQGFALKLCNPRAFSRAIDLSELRDRFDFEPPQSFLYATSALRTALKDEYSDVSY